MIVHYCLIIINVNAHKNATIKSIYSQTLLCEYQKNILNCLVSNKCVNVCKLECLINEKKNINNKQIYVCNINNQTEYCNSFKNLVNNINKCNINYNSNFDIVNTCVNKILNCTKYKTNSAALKSDDYIFIVVIFGILFLCLCQYYKCGLESS